MEEMMLEKAKVKFRVIDFELEGGDAVVQASIQNLANVFAQQNGNRALPEPQPTLAALPAAEPVELGVLEPQSEHKSPKAAKGRPKGLTAGGEAASADGLTRCENCGDMFNRDARSK